MFKRLACLGTVLLLLGCQEEATWDGFIYPDQKDLFKYQHIGEFKTFELCKEACQKEIDRLNISEGYFQCGKNCTNMEDGVKSIGNCKEFKH